MRLSGGEQAFAFFTQQIPMFIQSTKYRIIIQLQNSVANQYYNIQSPELSLMLPKALPNQAFYMITIHRAFQLAFWNSHAKTGVITQICTCQQGQISVALFNRMFKNTAKILCREQSVLTGEPPANIARGRNVRIDLL